MCSGLIFRILFSGGEEAVNAACGVLKAAAVVELPGRVEQEHAAAAVGDFDRPLDFIALAHPGRRNFSGGQNVIGGGRIKPGREVRAQLDFAALQAFSTHAPPKSCRRTQPKTKNTE